MASTVDHLIDVALAAMEHASAADDASDIEVLSATFTMALRTAQMAVKRNPELREQILRAAQLVLLNCADERTLH